MNLNERQDKLCPLSRLVFASQKEGRINGRLRLKSGGHGQKVLLDKYGIEYNIVKIYPNGVRVGNVPYHMKR